MIGGGPLFENNIARRIYLIARIANEQEALRIRLIQQQHAEEHIRFVKDFARRAMYSAFGMVLGIMCVGIVYSMRNLNPSWILVVIP
jgi:hypothetical protein